MKSILLITQNFIPYTPSLGRVIRLVTLVDFLHRHNYKVFVLTSKGVHFKYLGYEEILDDINLIYIEDKFKIIVQTKQAKRFSSKKTNKKPLFKRFCEKIIKYLVESVAIPDLGIFMVKRYAQLAGQIITNEKITDIIISSPPHSMQMVGVKLKQQFGNKISLISEYRDSWNTSPAASKKFYLSRLISERMEKSVLMSCDKFIYVSPPMLDKLQEKYSLAAFPESYLIMNGFIEEQNTTVSKKRERNAQSPISIGYFGQASDRKEDPHSLFNLLKVIRSHHAELNNLIFEFYGAVEFSSEKSVLYTPLNIHGSISHDAALKKMAEMDFLLFLYSDPASSDEVISGKLFEYISVRRPILCLGPKNMEARRIVEKYGIGITIDIEDPQDIIKRLKSLPDFLNNDFYKDLDISQFKRENQYKKFLELLH